MANQCTRCIHKEVCGIIKTIEELKEKYSFIQDISCVHAARTVEQATRKQESAERAPEPKAEPKAKPTGGKKENAERNVPERNGNADDGKNISVMDIDVEKLPMQDGQVAPCLAKAGIRTVGDVYGYDKSRKGWAELPGMNQEMHRALDGTLQALHQPALKAWES